MHRRLPLAASLGLVLSSLVGVATAHAQATFFKTIGAASYSEAYAITNSGDGGYVMTGRTGANFNDDIYVVKTNAVGDTVWTRRLAGPGAEYGYAICQAGDGGFVVAGFGSGIGAGENDVVLVKLGATGAVLWSRTIGGTRNEEAYGIQRTSDGGFIIGGMSTASLSNDFMLIKTDAAGATSWIRTYGGQAGDQAYAVCITADGGYALAGRTTSYGGGTFEVFVVKTDATGNLLWSNAYGTASTDESMDIIGLADGGLLVAGRTFGSGAGLGDLLLIRTDAGGALQWNRTIGGTGTEDRPSVLPKPGGGYIISATTGSFGTANSLWLVATDGTGNPAWSQAYGGSSLETAYGVAVASDVGYVVAGSSNSYGPGFSANLALLKTDAAGGNTCEALATTAVAGTASLTVTGASPTVLAPTFTNAAVAFAVTSVGDPYTVCTLTSAAGPERPGPVHQVALYPNPALDGVTVLWSGEAASGGASPGPATVSLFDATGRLVMSRRSATTAGEAHEERLDLGTLPRGVYFVTVVDDRGATTRKLVRR